MGLIIFLRREKSVNRFRDTILGAIQSGLGDEALICSGFFQEDGKFSAAVTSKLANSLAAANVRTDLVGVYNGVWIQRFRRFRDNLASEGVAVDAYTQRGLRWHAKVFILKKAGSPILGIVGSSNLTRPAFHNDSPFNRETDVVMWPDTAVGMGNTASTVLAANNDPYSYIVADYDPRRNAGLTILDRLIQLEKDVRRSALSKLD